MRHQAATVPLPRLLTALAAAFGLVALSLSLVLGPGTASATTNAVDRDANQTSHWEEQGFGTCTKDESVDGETYTLGEPAEGHRWTLLVIKAGSGPSNEDGNPRTVYEDPVVGTQYEAPVGKNGQLKEISHVIVCSDAEEPTEPTEPDICPNIDGDQTELEEGWTVDDQGNCVEIPTPVTAPAAELDECVEGGVEVTLSNVGEGVDTAVELVVQHGEHEETVTVEPGASVSVILPVEEGAAYEVVVLVDGEVLAELAGTRDCSDVLPETETPQQPGEEPGEPQEPGRDDEGSTGGSAGPGQSPQDDTAVLGTKLPAQSDSGVLASALPRTGSELGVLLAAAAGLLAAGAGAVFLSRRSVRR